jgi:hypothetical protein
MRDTITEVVDDQLNLSQLNDMFDSVDANINALNDTITSIKTSENTYDYFTTQIDAFKQYEEAIQTTLNQLQSFVDDPTAINNTKTNMTTLENKVRDSTSNYKTIVDSNNTLAETVRNNYDAYKQRIMVLSDRAVKLQQVKTQYTNMIAQKRAINYDKTVTLKLPPSTVPYATGNSFVLDMTGIQKNTTNQLYDIGRKFFVADDKDEKLTIILYTGPRKEISLTINSLTTAASGVSFDTTTNFNVQIMGSTGALVNYDVSMSSPTPKFFVDMGDTIVIKAKSAISISSCQMTIGWELKEDPPILLPSLIYDICGWWGGKTNKIVVDSRGNGYVYLDGATGRATGISSTQFKIAGPYGDMIGTLIGTDENPTITFGDGSSWTPPLVIAPLPIDPTITSITERTVTTTLDADYNQITDPAAFNTEWATTIEQNLGLPAGSVVVTGTSQGSIIVNYIIKHESGNELDNIVQVILAEPENVVGEIKTKYNAVKAESEDKTPGALPKERMFNVALDAEIDISKLAEFLQDFKTVTAKAMGLSPSAVEVIEIVGTTITAKAVSNRTNQLAAAVNSFVSTPVPVLGEAIAEKYNINNAMGMDTTSVAVRVSQPTPVQEPAKKEFTMAFNEDSGVSTSPTFATDFSAAVAEAMGLPVGSVKVNGVKGNMVTVEATGASTPADLETKIQTFVAAAETQLSTTFKQTYNVSSIVAMETTAAASAVAAVKAVVEAAAAATTIRSFSVAFDNESVVSNPNFATDFAAATAKAMGLTTGSVIVKSIQGGNIVAEAKGTSSTAIANAVSLFVASPDTRLPSTFKQTYNVSSVIATDTTTSSVVAASTINNVFKQKVYEASTRVINVAFNSPIPASNVYSFTTEFAVAAASSMGLPPGSVVVKGVQGGNIVAEVKGHSGASPTELTAAVNTFIAAPASSLGSTFGQTYSVNNAIAVDTTAAQVAKEIVETAILQSSTPVTRTYNVAIDKEIPVSSVTAFSADVKAAAAQALGVEASAVSIESVQDGKIVINATGVSSNASLATIIPDTVKQTYGISQVLVADNTAASVVAAAVPAELAPTTRTVNLTLNAPLSPQNAKGFANDFAAAAAQSLGLPAGSVLVIGSSDSGKTFSVQVSSAQSGGQAVSTAVSNFIANPLSVMGRAVSATYNVGLAVAAETTPTPPPAVVPSSEAAIAADVKLPTTRSFELNLVNAIPATNLGAFAADFAATAAQTMGLPAGSVIVLSIGGRKVGLQANAPPPTAQTTQAEATAVAKLAAAVSSFVAAPTAVLPAPIKEQYNLNMVVANDTTPPPTTAIVAAAAASSNSTPTTTQTPQLPTTRTFNLTLNATIPPSNYSAFAADFAAYAAATMELPTESVKVIDVQGNNVVVQVVGQESTPAAAATLATAVTKFVQAPLASLPTAVKEQYNINVAVAKDTTPPPMTATITPINSSSSSTTPTVIVPQPTTRNFSITLNTTIPSASIPAFLVDFAIEVARALALPAAAVSNVAVNGKVVTATATSTDTTKLSSAIAAFVEAPISALNTSFKQTYGISLVVAADTTVVTPPPTTTINTSRAVNPTSQVRTFTLTLTLSTPMPSAVLETFKTDFATEAETAMGLPPGTVTVLMYRYNNNMVLAQAVSPLPEVLVSAVTKFVASPIAILPTTFTNQYNIKMGVAVDTTTMTTTVYVPPTPTTTTVTNPDGTTSTITTTTPYIVDNEPITSVRIANLLPGSYAPNSNTFFQVSSLKKVTGFNNRWVLNSDLTIVYLEDIKAHQILCNSSTCLTINVGSFVTTTSLTPVNFVVQHKGLRNGVATTIVPGEQFPSKTNYTLYVEQGDTILLSYSSAAQVSLSSGYITFSVTNTLSQWTPTSKLLSIVASSYDDNNNTAGVIDTFSFNTRGLTLEQGFTDRWNLDSDFYIKYRTDLKCNEIVARQNTTKTVTVSIGSLNTTATTPLNNTKIKIAHWGTRNGALRKILEGTITPAQNSSYTAFVQPNDSLFVSFNDLNVLNIVQANMKFIVQDNYALSTNSWTSASPTKMLAILSQLYDNSDATSDIVNSIRFRTDGLVKNADNVSWKLDDDFDIKPSDLDDGLGHDLVVKKTKMITFSIAKLLTNIGGSSSDIVTSLRIKQKGTRNQQPWTNSAQFLISANATAKLYVREGDVVSVSVELAQPNSVIYVYDAAISVLVENVTSSWNDALVALPQFYDNNASTENIVDGITFVTEGLTQLSASEWTLNNDFTLKFDQDKKCHVIVSNVDKTVTATIAQSLTSSVAQFEIAHWGLRNGINKKISAGLKTISGSHLMQVRKDDIIIVSIANAPTTPIYIQDVRIAFATATYTPSVTSWDATNKFLGVKTQYYDNLPDTATIQPLFNYNVESLTLEDGKTDEWVLDSDFNIKTDQIVCKTSKIVTIRLKDNNILTDNPLNDANTRVFITQKGARNDGETVSVLLTTEVWGNNSASFTVKQGDIIETTLSSNNVAPAIYVYDACLAFTVDSYTFTTNSTWTVASKALSVKAQVYDNLPETSTRLPAIAFNTNGLAAGTAANTWNLPDQEFLMTFDPTINGHKISYLPATPLTASSKAVTISFSKLFTNRGATDNSTLFNIVHTGIRNATVKTIATESLKVGVTPSPILYLQPNDTFTISLNNATTSLNLYDAVINFSISDFATNNGSWTPNSGGVLSVVPQFYDAVATTLDVLQNLKLNTSGLTDINASSWTLDSDFTLRTNTLGGHEILCNSKKTFDVSITSLKTSKNITDTTTTLSVVQSGSVELAVPLKLNVPAYTFNVQAGDTINFNFIPDTPGDEIYIHNAVFSINTSNNTIGLVASNEIIIVPDFKTYGTSANLTFSNMGEPFSDTEFTNIWNLKKKDLVLQKGAIQHDFIYGKPATPAFSGPIVNLKVEREVLVTDLNSTNDISTSLGVLVNYGSGNTRIFPFNANKSAAFDINPNNFFAIKLLENASNRTINNARFKLSVTNPIINKVILKVVPASYAPNTNFNFDVIGLSDLANANSIAPINFDLGKDFFTSASSGATTIANCNMITYGGWTNFNGFNQRITFAIDSLYTNGTPVNITTSINLKKQTKAGIDGTPISITSLTTNNSVSLKMVINSSFHLLYL